MTDPIEMSVDVAAIDRMRESIIDNVGMQLLNQGQDIPAATIRSIVQLAATDLLIALHKAKNLAYGGYDFSLDRLMDIVDEVKGF